MSELLAIAIGMLGASASSLSRVVEESRQMNTNRVWVIGDYIDSGPA